MREIIFYRTESDKCPVKEFLDSLNGRQAQKVVWVLKLIEELIAVPKQYFKKLIDSDELWEIRVQFEGNIFRILGFFDGRNVLILNHGFRKKSQKTPQREIELSKQRKKDYFRSKHRERFE